MVADDIKKLLSRKYLTFYTCVAVVTIMPVYVYYLPPLMVLWAIFWLLENDFRFKKDMFEKNKAGILFLLFIAFYLWQICGLFFADTLDSGLERIVKRLSFLIFPMVLFFPSDKVRLNISLLLRLFAYGTLLYAIYCLGHAFQNSLTNSDGIWKFNPHPVDFDYENFFISSRLSFPIHPSYLSMYILISVLISLESLFDSSLSGIKRVSWLLMIVYFLLILYLLSSRAGIIAAVLLIPSYLTFKLYKKSSKWFNFIFGIALISVFLIVVKTNERLYSAFEGISKNNLSSAIAKDDRYLIWKSAIGVIKKNLLFGVGTGDASAELKKEFTYRGFSEGYYDNLNAHNQYLEILLENGIIGLLLFLAIICYMGYIAVSEHNFLLVLFLLMALIFFIFETILNRLSGVTFFSLFSFLLIQFKPK